MRSIWLHDSGSTTDIILPVVMMKPFAELIRMGMAIRGRHGQYLNCSQCRRMICPGDGCAKCNLDNDYTLHPLFVALFYRPRKNWESDPMGRPYIPAIPHGLLAGDRYGVEAHLVMEVRLMSIPAELAIQAAPKYDDPQDPRGWRRRILDKICSGNFNGLYESGAGPESNREKHWAQMCAVHQAAITLMHWGQDQWGSVTMESLYGRADYQEVPEDFMAVPSRNQYQHL